MYLKEIINTKSNKKFNNIILNSKNVKKGDLFIPFGGVIDRNKYISDAIKKHIILFISLFFYYYMCKPKCRISSVNQGFADGAALYQERKITMNVTLVKRKIL